MMILAQKIVQRIMRLIDRYGIEERILAQALLDKGCLHGIDFTRNSIPLPDAKRMMIEKFGLEIEERKDGNGRFYRAILLPFEEAPGAKMPCGLPGSIKICYHGNECCNGHRCPAAANVRTKRQQQLSIREAS
jgi:hypothetical protein